MKVNMQEIDNIAQRIKEGKIVIFPTETVYGIGTNAFDDDACKRIYEIKERPMDKPLIVLISNLDMLYNIAKDVNELEKKLIDEFWPGPLTIVFEKKENCEISDIVTSGGNSVGIRMTSGIIPNLLIEKSGVPIVAPSANISGKSTGIKIKNIIEELGDKVDYILDFGDVEKAVESTIVKVVENKIYILREGKILKKQLKKIGKIKN